MTSRMVRIVLARFSSAARHGPKVRRQRSPSPCSVRPSLGAFLPPIIKAQKFDQQQGLDLTFVERPPDAYVTQFNSGEFQVGGSAATLTIAVARNRGVPVTYLFNLFDFWGALVTSNQDIKTLKDLAGKQIAAAKVTTNFAMIDWFARRQGLDLSKQQVVNTAPPGLMSYAMADRADAVHLWEPGYTQLIAKKPTARALDLDIRRQWRQFAGGDAIPTLGVAAHESWIKQHANLVQPLYRAYKAAGEWARKNPARGRGADPAQGLERRSGRDQAAHRIERSARHEHRRRSRDPQGDRSGLQRRRVDRLHSPSAGSRRGLRARNSTEASATATIPRAFAMPLLWQGGARPARSSIPA